MQLVAAERELQQALVAHDQKLVSACEALQQEIEVAAAQATQEVAVAVTQHEEEVAALNKRLETSEQAREDAEGLVTQLQVGPHQWGEGFVTHVMRVRDRAGDPACLI